MLVRLAVTALAAVTMAAGCSKPKTTKIVHVRVHTPDHWTNYQYNEENNPVFPGRFQREWTFDTGGKVNGSLAVVGNTVYVTSFSKKVFALDIATGKPRWSAPVDDIVMSTPIVAHGLVIVGTGTNRVAHDVGNVTLWKRDEGNDYLALDQHTGAVVWRFHTEGEDMPTPALSGSTLVVSNGDMHAYGIDLTSGHQLWRRHVPGVSTMSSTTIRDGVAFMVVGRGVDYSFRRDATHLVALSVRDGSVRWSSPHGNADCSPTVVGAMVICEGSEYVHYPNGAWGYRGRNDIEAYSRFDGNLIWRWVGDAGYYTNVGSNERAIAGVAHNGVLYQAVPTTNEFVALRISDGKIIARMPTAGPVKMSAIVFDNTVIFGDTTGLLYTVDADTLRLRHIVPYKEPFSTCAPVVVGRTLFIANGSSVLAIPLKQLHA